MAQKLPFIIQSGVRTRGEPRVTGLTGMLCASARYDFAEHGGSIGTKALGVIVPAGALVFGRGIVVVETFNDEQAVVGFTLNTPESETLTTHEAAWTYGFWDEPGGEPDPDYVGPPDWGVGPEGDAPNYVSPPADHGWDAALREFTFSLSGGPFQLEEDREVKFIIQDEPVTAGVVDCHVFFVMPPAA